MTLALSSLFALSMLLIAPRTGASLSASLAQEDPLPVRTMWVGSCKQRNPDGTTHSFALAIHIQARDGDTWEATGWYPDLGNAVTQFAGRLGADGAITIEESRVLHPGSDTTRGRVVAGAKYAGEVTERRIVASGSLVDPVTKVGIPLELELLRGADLLDSSPMTAASPGTGTPDAARSAVFWLQLVYASDKSGAEKHEKCAPARIAFWIAPDLAVTSLDGLAQAGSIETLEKRGRTKFTWVASDRGSDLALLRAKNERPPDAAFLELAAADSIVPLEQQFLVFSALQRVTPPELLPLVELSGAENGAHPLLQGREGMALGGLPLVDTHGRLTGICSWAPAGTPITTDRVLPVERVRNLMDVHAVNASSSEPVTVQGVAPLTSRTVPSVSWDAHVSTLSHVKTTCRQFADKITCDACAGRGYDEKFQDVIEGGRVVTKRDEIDCPKCSRDRLRKPTDLWNHSRVVAAILSSAVTSDKGDETKAVFENGARAASAVNPVEFAKRLNDAAHEELDPRNVVPGRSVMFIVPEGEWTAREFSPLGADATRVALKEHNLILLSPDTRNVQGESAQVLIVGTTCGVLRFEGESFTLLDHVMAVPIRPEGDVTGR